MIYFVIKYVLFYPGVEVEFKKSGDEINCYDCMKSTEMIVMLLYT